MKLSKIIALVLVGCSVLIGIFIIGWQNFSAKVPTDQKNENPAAVNLNNNAALTNAVEPIPTSNLNSVLNSTSQTGSVASQLDPNNLTQQLAQRVAKSILDKNPNGPTSVNNLQQLTTLNPNALVNQGLTDELKNFDYSRFQSTVDVNKIKIVAAGDASANNHYLIGLSAILQNKFLNISVDQKNLNLADFNTLKDAAAQAVTELYNLPVPQKLASYHIQEIKIAGSFENAASAIVKASDDPLLALVAVEFLSKANQEFADVNKKLQQYINTN